MKLADPVEEVSFILFDAIKHILRDSLMNRARTCDGLGLELWRKLYAEHQGSGAQVFAAKAARFNDPPRCTSILQLWDALPAWELLFQHKLLVTIPND